MKFGAQQSVKALVVGQAPGPEYDGIGPIAVSSGSPAHLAYAASKGGKNFIVLDGAESPGATDVDLALMKIAKAGAAVINPTFSPEGGRFAYFVRRSVKAKLVDRNGNERPEGLTLLPLAAVVDGKEAVEQVGTCTSPILSRFLFSPDNKRVAYAVANMGNIKDAGEVEVRATIEGRVTVDGEQGPIYTSTGSIPYAVEIGYDLLGNSPFPLVKKTVNPSWMPVSAPVFSPDSRHVAYVVCLFLTGIQIATGIMLLLLLHALDRRRPRERPVHHELGQVRLAHPLRAQLDGQHPRRHPLRPHVLDLLPEGLPQAPGADLDHRLLLFVLFLAFGFSGYLLPWNELSYFATRVGTDIAGSLPFIGKWLKTVILGGPAISQATLSRFFWFHVALLPLAALVLSSPSTSWLVQTLGMSRPDRDQGQEAQGDLLLPGLHLQGRPGLDARSSSSIGVLCVFLPWEIGTKADPFAATPLGIKPEWYFTFMFTTLKLVPGHVLFVEGEKLAILGFMVGGLLWMLVPFLDRRAGPRRTKSPVFTWIGIALAALHRGHDGPDLHGPETLEEMTMNIRPCQELSSRPLRPRPSGRCPAFGPEEQLPRLPRAARRRAQGARRRPSPQDIHQRVRPELQGLPRRQPGPGRRRQGQGQDVQGRARNGPDPGVLRRAATPTRPTCGRFNPNLRVDQLSQYGTSKHGQLLKKGDTKAAVCTDCHGVHGIQTAKFPKSPTFPWNIPHDGQHLACVCWDEGRAIVVLDGKTVGDIPAPEANFAQSVTFSPDGGRLAFVVERLGGTTTAWHTVVVDGKPQKEYSVTSAMASRVREPDTRIDAHPGPDVQPGRSSPGLRGRPGRLVGRQPDHSGRSGGPEGQPEEHPLVCSACHENMEVVVKYNIHAEHALPGIHEERPRPGPVRERAGPVRRGLHGLPRRPQHPGRRRASPQAKQPGDLRQLPRARLRRIQGRAFTAGRRWPGTSTRRSAWTATASTASPRPAKRRSPTSDERILDTCSGCHARPEIMKKYGVPEDRIQTFIESFHGIAIGYRLPGRGQLHELPRRPRHPAGVRPASRVHPANLRADLRPGRLPPGHAREDRQGQDPHRSRARGTPAARLLHPEDLDHRWS